MNNQRNAQLYREPFDSFEEAQAWTKKVKAGEVKSFVPVSGKVAGSHIEPGDGIVPYQAFDPKIKEGTEVVITNLIWCEGDISINGDKYFPFVYADVDYEPADAA